MTCCSLTQWALDKFHNLETISIKKVFPTPVSPDITSGDLHSMHSLMLIIFMVKSGVNTYFAASKHNTQALCRILKALDKQAVRYLSSCISLQKWRIQPHGESKYWWTYIEVGTKMQLLRALALIFSAWSSISVHIRNRAFSFSYVL